jgi:cysteinyl-tRNA synthetase
MDNDFNTSNLITYLLDLVKELNAKLRAKEDFVDIYDKIMLINYILGLDYQFVTLSDDDKDIYNKWLSYRNDKDFENADKMRTILVERNII